MTDVAPAPAGDTGNAAPAASPVAMETLHEAASNRFATLKADRAWGARVLAKDPAAVNERQTLLQILHGTGDDVSKSALAASIGLEPRQTLAAADRAKAEADAAAELTRVRVPYEVAKNLSPLDAANLQSHMSEWAGSLGLPPSTTRTILDRITAQGPALAKMSPEDHARWLDRQNVILDRMAKSKELADEWRATAKAVFDKAGFFNQMPVLNDAAIVRHTVNGAEYVAHNKR
jgi:hypothetical protein